MLTPEKARELAGLLIEYTVEFRETEQKLAEKNCPEHLSKRGACCEEHSKHAYNDRVLEKMAYFLSIHYGLLAYSYEYIPPSKIIYDGFNISPFALLGDCVENSFSLRSPKFYMKLAEAADVELPEIFTAFLKFK